MSILASGGSHKRLRLSAHTSTDIDEHYADRSGLYFRAALNRRYLKDEVLTISGRPFGGMLVFHTTSSSGWSRRVS